MVSAFVGLINVNAPSLHNRLRILRMIALEILRS
jgi:hypothetical protein